jgi:hypothetical protein
MKALQGLVPGKDSSRFCVAEHDPYASLDYSRTIYFPAGIPRYAEAVLRKNYRFDLKTKRRRYFTLHDS